MEGGHTQASTGAACSKNFLFTIVLALVIAFLRHRRQPENWQAHGQ